MNSRLQKAITEAESQLSELLADHDEPLDRAWQGIQPGDKLSVSVGISLVHDKDNPAVIHGEVKLAFVVERLKASATFECSGQMPLPLEKAVRKTAETVVAIMADRKGA